MKNMKTVILSKINNLVCYSVIMILVYVYAGIKKPG